MNGNNEYNLIESLIPKTTGAGIDWTSFERTKIRSLLAQMSEIKQEKEYHGEGDVLTHTKLVCQALIEDERYQAESDDGKTVLFLAALLHDVGKITRTREENGKILSPKHSLAGSLMAREFLWKELGLCGNERARDIRESVCTLIKYHSFPPYAIREEDAERRLLKIAVCGELAPLFSVKRLCILERADVFGRIAKDKKECLGRVEYCELLAEEIGCLERQYLFPSTYAQRGYFQGRTSWKDQPLFNDTWGEVILLCGLPGTGKDTWIKKNYPNLPMLSLDEIRKELSIPPTKEQGEVVSLAKERAKEYLRKKQPFVWNATNITAGIRGKLISLFERYGASVKTVFLETEWEEEQRRNENRLAVVPQKVIEKMLSKTTLPERFESEIVVWETT